MKSYQKQIINRLHASIERDETPIVFLEGGHFDPRLGPDAFSENSLQEALDFGFMLMKMFSSKIRIVLGLLVDDLGLECGGETCSIGEKSPSAQISSVEDLPSNLRKTLEKSPLFKAPRFLIFSERAAKNRAIKTLRKIQKEKKNIVDQERVEGKTKLSFLMPSGESVLLAEQEGEVFRAKCPSIMGQHYRDCLKKAYERFPEMHSFFIVDYSEMIDKSKVVAGANGAGKVFIQEKGSVDLFIMNVFYIDEEGSMLMHEEHHFPSSEFSKQEAA